MINNVFVSGGLETQSDAGVIRRYNETVELVEGLRCGGGERHCATTSSVVGRIRHCLLSEREAQCGCQSHGIYSLELNDLLYFCRLNYISSRSLYHQVSYLYIQYSTKP